MNKIEDPAPNRRLRPEDRIAAELRELEIAQARTNLATRVLTAASWALRDGSGAEVGSPYPEVRVVLPELVDLLVGYLAGEVRAPVGSGLPPAPEEPPRETTLVVDQVEPTRLAEPEGKRPSKAQPSRKDNSAGAPESRPTSNGSNDSAPTRTLPPAIEGTRVSSRRGDAQKSRKAGGATTNAGGAGKWRSEYTEAED